MHTVAAAAATLQFISQARKQPPTYIQSLTAPIMAANMESQSLVVIFLVLSHVLGLVFPLMFEAKQ